MRAFKLIPLHGTLDLIHYKKITGGGTIQEIRKLTDPLFYFEGQNEKLEELFMIYPLEAIGYEDSVKSPYIELLYRFRKSIQESQRIAILGYSLRDPTIGSIFEDTIVSLIGQQRLMPMSENLEDRKNEAKENNLKIIVFTRNQERLMTHLNDLNFQNLRSVISPIQIEFPKVINDEEPYFNVGFMDSYQEVIRSVVNQLKEIDFFPPGNIDQINSSISDRYKFRVIN